MSDLKNPYIRPNKLYKNNTTKVKKQSSERQENNPEKLVKQVLV